jgi:hypothetical protein
MIDRFKKSAKRSTIGSNQAEAASGYDSTALMMGKIVISKLTKRANLEKYLDAEIEERNIQPANTPIGRHHYLLLTSGNFSRRMKPSIT